MLDTYEAQKSHSLKREKRKAKFKTPDAPRRRKFNTGSQKTDGSNGCKPLAIDEATGQIGIWTGRKEGGFYFVKEY